MKQRQGKMRFANNFILISVLFSFQISFSRGFCFSTDNSKACLCPPSSFQNSELHSAAAAAGDTNNERCEAILDVLSRIESNLMSPTDNNLNQLYKKCLKSVKVDESSIEGAGMGLFATKNIKAGSIISLYPVHAVGVTSETETSTTTTYTALRSDDQSYFDDDGRNTQTADYVHFLIGSRPFGGNSKSIPFREDETLFVDVNPNRAVSSPWLGHYINDGAIVEKNNEEGVLDYYRETNNAKNCVHIPFGPSPILASVTTKKVKKGDEFFTCYGCSYWMDALFGCESTEMTDRIVAEARETASDIFATMNQAKVTYAAHNDAFEEVIK
eukprot:CAMPEP_0194227894 /NCGR_PEP_ID=MMETSP0156-20130528/43095_1 /TAXON_ID=33649 /ORGANISM="Thalassionema nitzschioides, Strain L26-B" /LENGTH=327 /DNA_ID=CAMNT_0038960391 /DNA_START=35 /DNA_END=1018 /DNA_ORIENTATION=+